mmetsp:Transcript_53019/g.151031  ORF Transcript_53019/g.151031 Transcript_53019/m.151031 type:complete len:180 (-) Transcript_53019:175-714(-)
MEHPVGAPGTGVLDTTVPPNVIGAPAGIEASAAGAASLPPATGSTAACSSAAAPPSHGPAPRLNAPLASFDVDSVDTEGSKACPHRVAERPGVARRVAGTIGGLGYRIFDNMSFVGEVLVDWLELDKPKYYHEMKELRRQRRKEEKKRQQQEAARIASIEEAGDGSADAPESGDPAVQQ